MNQNRTCRVCHEIGQTRKGLCANCWRDYDRRRGTKTQRGYGSTKHQTPLGVMSFDQYYQRMRKQTGHTCWRCGKPIPAGKMHIGHHDTDRTRIMGPECASCNLSAAGKNAHLHHH